jgi:hypothetical protein
MLIMHKGCELVPVKGNGNWHVQIFSGGRLLTTTMLFATEEAAMTEAKEAVDGLRDGRRPLAGRR